MIVRFVSQDFGFSMVFWMGVARAFGFNVDKNGGQTLVAKRCDKSRDATNRDAAMYVGG